jgi:hypothetical protein
MVRNIRRSALVLFLCGAWSVFALDYEIKIERPIKAGLKYSVSATGTTKQAQIVKVNGQVAQQQQQAFSAALDADVVVLTVNAKGQPKSFEYTVRKFTRTDADKVAELVPAGKVLVVDRTKEKAPPFALKDGGALEPQAMQALDLVISEGKKDTADDDLIFGTSERKAVGAEWPINTEKAAASLSEKDLKIAKENLSGTVRLNGVEQQNGMECLNMTMTVEAKNAEIALPKELKLEKSSFKVTATGLLPVDTTQPQQAFSAQMQMLAVAKGGQPGQEVVVEMTMERSGNEKRVYTK